MAAVQAINNNYSFLKHGINKNYYVSSSNGISSIECNQDPALKPTSNEIYNKLLANDGYDIYNNQSMEASQDSYGMNKCASFPNVAYNTHHQQKVSSSVPIESQAVLSQNKLYGNNNMEPLPSPFTASEYSDILHDNPVSMDLILNQMLDIMKDDKNNKLAMLTLTKLFERVLMNEQVLKSVNNKLELKCNELNNNINKINNILLFKLDNIEKNINGKILKKLDDSAIIKNEEMDKKLNKLLNIMVLNKSETEEADNNLVEIIELNGKNNLKKLNLLHEMGENNKLCLNELNNKLLSKFDEFENKINGKLEKLGYKLNLERNPSNLLNNKNNNNNKKNNNNNNNKKNNKKNNNKLNLNINIEKKLEELKKKLNSMHIYNINNITKINKKMEDIKEGLKGNKSDFMSTFEAMVEVNKQYGQQVFDGLNKYKTIIITKINDTIKSKHLNIMDEIKRLQSKVAVIDLNIKKDFSKFGHDLDENVGSSLISPIIDEEKKLTIAVIEGISIGSTINKEIGIGDNINNKYDILKDVVDKNKVENLNKNIINPWEDGDEYKENKILNIKKEDLKNMKDDELNDLILEFNILEDVNNEILFRQILTERDKL